MNIPQTSYNQYFAAAILGMQAYAAETMDKISRVARGIIYYGRMVVQSRLYVNACRMPRQNKFVITDDAGTFTAGSIVSTIVHGTIQNGELPAVSASTVVTTPWVTNKDTTMANHAANIKAALSDCFSCVYAAAGHTITFIGDGEDIISCTQDLTGVTGTMAAAPAVISSADVIGDVIGLSFLTHNRQQQISAGAYGNGLTYYMDGEPVNICRKGSIWVYSEEAVTPADTPYGRLITNSSKYAGYIGKSSDSSKCITLTGSKFQDQVTAAGLVPLTINLPQ